MTRAFVAMAAVVASTGCRVFRALTMEPTHATIAVGQTVQLTPLDALGRPVSGAAVQWSSANPTVATVTPNGLVTGGSVGLDTVTALSGRRSGSALVVVTPKSSTWTHEPGGLSGLANTRQERDYDFTPHDLDGTYPTNSGWYNEYASDYRRGWLSLVTDSSAPVPGAVMQVMYPKGFSGGTAPGEIFYRHRTVREYYLGFHFKISRPYQNVGSNHNKILYIFAASGRDIVFEFFGPEPYHFAIAEYVSSPSGAEIDHVGSTPIALANWYTVELSISYATGRITWWVNGVEDATFAADLAQTGGAGLTQTQLNPTYGGGGLPAKPQADYVWYNHVHMSGSP